jgi:hypothetical protein
MNFINVIKFNLTEPEFYIEPGDTWSDQTQLI